MNEMIAFCTAILNAICDFLITPPVFYLFSLVRSLLKNLH